MATERKNKKRKNTNWKKQFEKVAQYCEKEYGYTVKRTSKEGGYSVFIPDSKEIIIYDRRKPEVCFYHLLHEVGHMLLEAEKKFILDYNRRMGFVYDNFSFSSLANKTAEVEEEFEAWKLGFELAQKLQLKINRKNFEQLKASELSSYFLWAVERKINKRIQEALVEADKEHVQKRKREKKRRG